MSTPATAPTTAPDRPAAALDAALDELSRLPQDAFVARLEGIFEHSPWIAERAWSAGPFASIDALHAAMCLVVDTAAPAEQLGLICAHPELAGKEAEEGTLTTASTGEQRGAGLDQCSKEELQRLRRLNQDYRARFGFPFTRSWTASRRGSPTRATPNSAPASPRSARSPASGWMR
jgi:2-oxo-4-hydroxy-4-carboxy-5-ureidoimidazoline decarboxylase